VEPLSRQGEVEHEIVEHSVALYSAGYYEKMPQQQPVQPPVAEMPVVEAYTGPVEILPVTRREMTPLPLEQHVFLYHAGHYDTLPTMEEGPISRSSRLPEGYPAQMEPYHGPVDTTHRADEAQPEPLDSRVTVYSSGAYEQLPSTTEKVEERKPSALAAITGLFTRRHHEQGYPVDSEPYTGPTALTSRVGEAERSPLDTSVSIYHSGRSDEYVTAAATAGGKLLEILKYSLIFNIHIQIHDLKLNNHYYSTSHYT